MKKLLLSIMSLAMFFSPVQILANEEEVVEDVVVEEETVVEEVTVDEEEIIETEDEVTVVTTNDGLGNWVQSGGKWYFKTTTGTYLKSNWYTIGGYNYYFDKYGVMQTGWIKYDGLWYYCASNGRELYGWQKINNKWYYFDKKGGYMYSNGVYNIDGKNYYFYPNGSMATGIVEEDGVNYLFDQNGQIVNNGWTKVDGKWYYAYNSVPLINGWKDIDGYTYCFNDKGQMVTGWYYYEGLGRWYYYDAKGHEVHGWQKIGGKWYYLNEYMMTGFCIIDNTYYHFTEKGVMDANKWVKDSGGNWYYHQANGKQVSGWYKVGTQWYYFNPKNHNIMARDCTIVIDGYTYIFAFNGTYTKTTAN